MKNALHCGGENISLGKMYTLSLLTDKEEDLHWSQKVSQCNLFLNRTVMEHTWHVWDQML